ncbi:MAG: EpsG family protein [Clostridium sp.]|nr:EpsG family protein [Clostridium sp.]
MLLQTIVVYTGLFLFMFLCTWHYRTYPLGTVLPIHGYRFVLYAVLLFSLIFGMRYGVGQDHLSYIRLTKLSSSELFDPENMEYGFAWLLGLFSRLNLHYTFFFGFVCLLQMFPLFLMFRRHVSVYPFLVFSIMIGGVWLTMMNGLRQQIAVSIMACAFLFLNKRQCWLYILLLLLASCFHRSAVVLFLLLPFIFIEREFFSHRKLQLVLMLLAGILSYGDFLVQYVISRWGQYAVFLNYDFYIDNFNKDTGLFSNNVGEKLGLGYFINLAITVALVYLSSQVKAWFNIRAYNRLYDIYFIGVLYRLLFFSSNLLQRINYYFFGIEFIWLALTLLFLYQKRDELEYKYWQVGLLSLVGLRFLAIIYRMSENTAEFIFFWQEDLYDLKPPVIM